jgi:hypothetical protein
VLREHSHDTHDTHNTHNTHNTLIPPHAVLSAGALEDGWCDTSRHSEGTFGTEVGACPPRRLTLVYSSAYAEVSGLPRGQAAK